MVWIIKDKFTLMETFAVQVLKAGKIPQHIAIIMDGNRRFSKKIKVTVPEGHSAGFEKLAKVLHWCIQLGIKEVTCYAMSIDNLKRTEEQVDCLFALANSKFLEFATDPGEQNELGIRLKVIGNLSIIPPELRNVIADAIWSSRNMQYKLKLNVAFVYTSRDEITESMRSVVQGIENGQLESSDVSPELLEQALYTEDSPPPDLLIRTSGEVRLSDFMLWQCSSSCLYFTPVLWPEFTLWDLLKSVFHYQRSCTVLNSVQKSDHNVGVNSPRVDVFLQDLYKSRLDRFKRSN